MYSNGFNETKVLAVLRTRIGWAGVNDTTQPTVDSDNKLSKSGRYYEDFHASVTIPAVNEVLAEEGSNNTQFSDYLSRLKDSVIMNALNAVFREIQIVDDAKVIYHNRFNYSLTEKDNSGSFVGMALNVAEGEYAVQITSVGLLFNEDVSFTLYLYSSLVLEPIKTIEVTANANTQTFVDLEDWVFDGKQDSRYFFGYYQDEIGSAKAIKIDSAALPRMTVVGVSGLETKADYDNLTFERQNISLTTDMSGLNPEITTFRDYTNSIVKNAQLFDEMQGLQMAIQIVNGILFSTRSNLTERLTGESAFNYFRDLNTAKPTEKEPFEPGLKSQYKAEIKRVHETFFPRPKSQSVNIYRQGDLKRYNNAFPKN